MTTPRPTRSRAFISYSHTDRQYLERLQRHLKPLLRESNLQVWDDTQIQPGSNWREEIEQALAEARVAILLVSAHFLASDFIAGEELPRMLEMAKNEGSRILPVILSSCVFNHTKLSQFQAVNDPTQPLNALPEYKQEEIWARLAEIVYKALSMPPDVPVPLSPSPPLGTTLLTYKGHSDIVRAVAWSPDSRRLASGSDDKTVQVWDITSGQSLAIYEGHSSKVNAVAWSPDGNWLASSSWAGTIQVWDAVTSQPRPTYKGHAKHVNAIAWSPDSTRLVSGGYIGHVEVWDAASGQSLTVIESSSEDTCGGDAVAWSPDGRRLASSSNLTVKVWDATSDQRLTNYAGHARQVMTIAWAPDSRRLASGDIGGTVQVWVATTKRCLTTYTGYKDGGTVYALAWSPDGKYIVSGGDDWRGNRDTTVHVWDAASGQHLNTYTGHVEPVYALAWSPDGKYIASASEDWTVQVWSASEQMSNAG